jgi:hypothetical protein
VSRAGRDSIDHAPGGHDDLANAVAGAINIAAEPFDDLSWVCGEGAEADAAFACNRACLEGAGSKSEG